MRKLSPYTALARIAACALLIISATSAKAQNPVTKVFEDWNTTSGSQNTFIKSQVRTATLGGSVYSFVIGSTLNSSGNLDILTEKFSPTGTLMWAAQYDGTGHGNDVGADVGIASNGEVYVTGTEYESSGDSSDAVVIKYSPSGAQRWTNKYNGSGSRNDGYSAILVSGTVVVTVGSCWSTSDEYDMLTRRIDTAGSTVWTTTYDNVGLNDGAVSLTARSGSLFVTGGTETVANTSYKIAVWKITPSSGAITTTTLSSSSSMGISQVTSIAEDASGQVYLCGTEYNISTGFDLVTKKFDASLNLLWSNSYNSSGTYDDVATSLCIDPHNNVIVTGYSNTASQGKDYTTIKYNSAGTQKWVKNFDGGVSGNDSATAVIVNDTDHIYVTGYSYNGSTNDYYTIRYDASGNKIWDIGFNGIHNSDDRGLGIALDTLGAVVVTGQNKFGASYTYTTVRYVEESTTAPKDTTANVSNSFVFTENRGQLFGTDSATHPEVRYYNVEGSTQVYFTDTADFFVLAKIDTSVSHHDSLCRVEMKYAGANSGLKIRPLDARSDYYNFFLQHIPDGRVRVQNYDQLASFNVWSNVDVMYGSNLSGLKTYFVCHPGGGGGAYANIDLKFSGADSVKIDGSGRLVIYTKYGKIIHRKAQAWQLDGSGNFSSLGWQPSYNLVAANEVKFTSLGSYNSSYPLIIAMDWGDQQVQNINNLDWSTYYGSIGNDVINDSKTDASSNMYIAGYGASNTFPVFNNYQPLNQGSSDAVAGKFKPDGTRDWVTFFGGLSSDQANGVAVDPSGNVYFVGQTNSTHFPIIQYTASGTSYYDSTAGSTDIFIFRLDQTGQICSWSTCYGGAGIDIATAAECDASGNIFLTGWSESLLFPTRNPGSSYVHTLWSAGAPDAVVVKFNASTLRNDWATCFGGTGGTEEQGNDIAVDASGNVVITGTTESTAAFPFSHSGSAYFDNTLGGTGDAFIARFDNVGVQQWATYYGGSDFEAGNGIGVNAAGDIFVTGRTASTDFPLLHLTGAYKQDTIGNTVGQDAFILKFASADCSRQWATYYGGTGFDEGMDVDIDQSNNLYITGYAGNNFRFPTNPAGTYSQSFMGGSNFEDAFCGVFAASTMAYTYGTYLGGTADDVANAVTVDGNGKLFVLGYTKSDTSAHFPLDNGAGIPYFQPIFGNTSSFSNTTDGFITRFDLSPILSVNEIANESIGLSLYPNPTNGQLFVTYDGVKTDDLKFTVFDMLGQTVRTVDVGKTYGAGSYVFDLSNIASGVYFVQAQCDGQTTSKKFIKQ